MPDSSGSISSQLSCKRCGTCCRNGGPALHTEDLPLLENGTVSLQRLVTVREQEPAFNQQTSSIDKNRSEFIKISGLAGSWCCCFWDQAESSCGIYHDRPLECRLLFCENTKAVEDVIGRDLLVRNDVVSSDADIMKAVRHHESSCPYSIMNDLVENVISDHSSRDILKDISCLVNKDLDLRGRFFLSRPDLQTFEMFLFGRPFFLALAPYGFKPVETFNRLKMEYEKDHNADLAIVSY